MLKGKNVLLRPFNLEDAKHIQELKRDFEGMKAFAGSPFPSNLASEEEWISGMYHKGINTSVHFIVEEIKNGNFVGYCVARNINYINRNAEFGILFSKNSRGKGYAKDALYLLMDYLFSEINLHKVYAYVIKGNDKALNIYKEIGFIEEGLIKEHIYQDGKYKDVVFISLYKRDFNE